MYNTYIYIYMYIYRDMYSPFEEWATWLRQRAHQPQAIKWTTHMSPTHKFILRAAVMDVFWLVGGWPTPLKNMTSSVGIIIPNIWKKKNCSKPPTSWVFFGELKTSEALKSCAT